MLANTNLKLKYKNVPEINTKKTLITTNIRQCKEKRKHG